MKRVTISQAHDIALQEARDHLIAKARSAVHTQKIAAHLSEAIGMQMTVSDETWDRNWTDIVEAVEYLDELSTTR